MKANIKVIYFIFAFALLLPEAICEAAIFEMALRQESIYTPGKINLSMELTDEAKYAGEYQFKISIYVTGSLIRAQTLQANRKNTVAFELAFPEVFSRAEGRCRCELFIKDDFIESRELPFVLWPSIEAYPSESLKSKEIWTYDISGKLPELFGKMQVKIVDATFQTTRDFSTPEIVFIGQDTDPNSMRLIAGRLKSVEKKPVIIFLKQKQFLKEIKIEIPEENNISRNVDCDLRSMLLKDLMYRDIMNMAANASYIKIQKDPNRPVKSYVTEVTKDEKNIYSFLCTVQEKEQIIICCQLPVTDNDDPRSTILLRNLLSFADDFIDSEKNR